jgi:hypothetical protein
MIDIYDLGEIDLAKLTNGTKLTDALSSIIAGGAQDKVIKNVDGSTLVFLVEEGDGLSIAIALPHYDNVKSLIEIRQSIIENEKLLLEMPKSIGVFKRIFEGDAEAYSEMPDAGKNMVIGFVDTLLDVFNKEIRAEVTKIVRGGVADLLVHLPSDMPDFDKHPVTKLLKDAQDLEINLKGPDKEKYVVSLLASQEPLFKDPPLSLIDDCLEQFCSNMVGPTADESYEILGSSIQDLKKIEKKYARKLPKEFRHLKEPPCIKLSLQELTEAVKDFIAAKSSNPGAA